VPFERSGARHRHPPCAHVELNVRRREISMPALRDRSKKSLVRYRRALHEVRELDGAALTDRDVIMSILGKRNRAQLET
jgi:hypothetical protein